MVNREADRQRIQQLKDEREQLQADAAVPVQERPFWRHLLRRNLAKGLLLTYQALI
jgi:hypothetical protein